MELNFVNSEKDRPKLYRFGYLFVKDKLVESKIYWKCELYHKVKCRARVITEDATVIKENNEHNHSGNAASVEVAKSINKIKCFAKETESTPHVIISNIAKDLSRAACGTFPKLSSVKRTIRRTRQAACSAPALPESTRDLEIPEKYRKTANGENFLLFDSGKEDANRIIVFGTQKNITLLSQSKHWYMDGTFKTVPSLFYQMYTIYGLKESLSIPLIYVLLPGKTELVYINFLNKFKMLQPLIAPESILIDYEVAMVNAISTIFPDCIIRGCFFHLTQAIYRKIQENGLKQQYDQDINFAFKIRHLPALAFVPVTHVVQAFDELLDVDFFPPEAHNIVDYFEDTWIGRPTRNNIRKLPRFKIEMWNCYESILSDRPKTNNSVEGWHRCFEAQISCSHPTIWKFIDGIKREQDINELKIEQFIAGEETPPKKKKYVDLNERIKRLVQIFDYANIVDYLRGITHNISL